MRTNDAEMKVDKDIEGERAADPDPLNISASLSVIAVSLAMEHSEI
jgi:hypothetical protein